MNTYTQRTLVSAEGEMALDELMSQVQQRHLRLTTHLPIHPEETLDTC